MSSAQATLDAAVDKYAAAQRRLEAIRARSTEQIARLDDLAARQAQLQARLDAHATYMYREGQMGAIGFLTGAQTFEQFATRWDVLARIGREDARLIRKLAVAKRQASATASDLIREQEAAARAVRELDTATAQAKRNLAASKADYAEYQRRIAQRAAASATSTASKKSSPAPTASRPRPTDTTGWKTGVASHYGKGSVGHRTADGTTIKADSMIVAHKTLPFGTLVEFSYNGKTAVGRVADRGPYVAGRDWDLGPGLVTVLGFNGVHQVKYRIVGR